MANRFVVTAVLAGTLAASMAAQMPKYGVTVAAEKNVDFAAIKTYTWTKGQPSQVKAIDAHIVAAVDRELAALGISMATSGTGDVLLAYYSLSRTDVDVKAKADDKGQRPSYAVGTLMIAMLDPGSRRRLIRLRTDQPIDTEPAKLETAIDRAVTELFESYPTRTAGKKK